MEYTSIFPLPFFLYFFARTFNLEFLTCYLNVLMPFLPFV